MRYFTKELWAGYNSSNAAERQRAFEQGEANARAYLSQLEGLRPRLSKQTYRFFTTENLHDGRLLEFITGDGIGHNVSAGNFDINAHKTSAQMKVLGANLDALYILKYKKVRRVVFDYPTVEPLFHDEGRQIGDWGYDELTAADDNYLRHEVLFASGTSILVECKYFSYARKKCEGTRYK